MSTHSNGAGETVASTDSNHLTGSTATNLAALHEWFVSHGGILHPSLALSPASEHNLRKGASIQISPDVASIAPLTSLIEAPFEITLSPLSIPHVAPFWPVAFLDGFAISPQILARFVLLEAWLQGENGFWWPYLRAVPQPNSKDIVDALGEESRNLGTDSDPVDTPLYWSAEDREWLRGTRIETATAERETLWREELEKARRIFREIELSNEDRNAWMTVQPRMWEAYTWPLYLWATTLLTSRSFPSKLLAGWQPQWDENSAWGRCEMAKVWREGGMSRKFPVMFPALDLGNHDPKAKVEWDCNGTSLKLITHEKLQGGKELNNNYGPKSNDELMVGYGFLVEDNEDDQVTMAVSTRPTAATEQSSRVVQSDSRKAVLSETRGLRRIPEGDREVDIIAILRGALSLAQAHTLALQFANQRELKGLASLNNVAAFFPATPNRCQALIVDRTIIALRAYRDRLEGSAPTTEPRSARQKMAATFRADQIDIIEQNIDQLEVFLLGLQKQKLIVTLHQLLSDESLSPDGIRLPLQAILQDHIGKKPKTKDVTRNGLLEFCFVTWLCLVYQSFGSGDDDAGQDTATSTGETVGALNKFLNKWYREILAARHDNVDVPSNEASTFNPDILAASSSYCHLMEEYGSQDGQQFAAVFRQLAEAPLLIQAATYIWRQENVSFESMDRLVFNGDAEVHEEFLFVERCS